jgi:hypothetical protein
MYGMYGRNENLKAYQMAHKDARIILKYHVFKIVTRCFLKKVHFLSGS